MNRSIILYFSAFYFFFSSFSYGQKEANRWYFGFNAGIDFSSGIPVAVTGGQIFSLEGCATISERTTGNLLFYTDGRFVYNKNHSVMPNGFGLLGSESSTQSGVIVPLPENDSIYYVFAVDAQAGRAIINGANVSSGFSGVSYSIVNLRLNGSLGDVDPLQKNIPLLTPTDEKLTAVKHCNGRDIWVITHKWKTDSMYAYLLTENGLSTTPVITKIGPKHTGPLNYAETLGYLKASPNGRKIAEVTYASLNQVEIYDFDNSTGILSNPIIDQHPVIANGGLYGVSFSPDNSKLYVSLSPDIVPGRISNIYQYDMLAGSSSSQDILASKMLVATTTVTSQGGSYTAMQIGPDGKIYIAKMGARTMDVINEPNKKGSDCNYVSGAITLAGSSICGAGLPNFIESLFDTSISFGRDTTVCGKFLLNAGNPGYDYLWSTGETTSFINAEKSGLYWVIASDGCNSKTDTINVINTGPSIVFPDSILVCSFPYTLDAGNPGSAYLWSTLDTTREISVSEDNTYTVIVTNNFCSVSDSTYIHLDTIPPLSNLLPNVFSPNNDGNNDFFSFPNHDLSTYNMTVYDPWGMKMFESTDPTISWDGKKNGAEVQEGVYYWILNYGSDCYSETGLKTESGFLSLFR